ncbi:M28 family metallopeptidase [Gemmatimonas sp. UBA7669]|uniref:M28 family metallopeptidase n=1 Tax=Gemmatimonas sp. UBA7669 TaxID=1946568 RepID=UPI0025C0F8BE|nr:M28 family metallopeptidase [Gemmatimonas sp. UBA7669]
MTNILRSWGTVGASFATRGGTLLSAVLLAACGGDSAAPVDDTALAPAYAAITADDIMRHTQVLAHDSLEGRAPATAGEDKTVRYLEEQFKAMGLVGGMPDGSFVQNVTLLRSVPHPEASFHVGSRVIPLSHPADYYMVTRREQALVEADAELVFVGYGVVAPEYDWDDYKDVDVKGKVLVMLVNDPAIPDAGDSTKLDANMFKGSAMTYYGRWTYKYEIASAKGAAGAIIIHETGPAGYPFAALSSLARENLDIKAPDGNMSRTGFEAWITQPKAEELLSAAGQSFAALKAAALRKDFRPVALGARARVRLASELSTVQSRNVVAMLPGSDAERKNEYVIYSAHWDHMGRDTTLSGDQIFNGALDNASGTAQMLSIAKGFAALPTKPARSILFVALTAEEKGLLGARYFATQPPVPLSQVLANINMDGVNQWGRTSDMVVIGFGNSTLDDVLADVLRPAGRSIGPDEEPEKGYFYRSDHFEFAKQGVPALYTEAGSRFIGKDSSFGAQKRDEYTSKDYHQVSDEVKPDWDLSGAVEDTRALLAVGYRVANGETWPTWKPGTEFKAKRDSTLAKRTP